MRACENCLSRSPPSIALVSPRKENSTSQPTRCCKNYARCGSRSSVNSIRHEAVALDTNVFVFALRKEVAYPACETLLFDKLGELQLYLPLQVFVELQHNLTGSEMRGVLRALLRAKTVTLDYAPAPVELITRWEQQGAKKGDA